MNEIYYSLKIEGIETTKLDIIKTYISYEEIMLYITPPSRLSGRAVRERATSREAMHIENIINKQKCNDGCQWCPKLKGETND